jgi:hypothetical protein
LAVEVDELIVLRSDTRAAGRGAQVDDVDPLDRQPANARLHGGA